MNLHQMLLILVARYRIVLYALAVTIGSALVVSLLMTKQYTATTSVVVDVGSPDPVAGLSLSAATMPNYMATQVDVINSVRVAQMAARLLKLDEDESLKAQWTASTDGRGTFPAWLASRLQKKLEAKPSHDSSVITLSYTAPDAAVAAATVNAFAQAYIETSVAMKVESAQHYTRWFGEQSTRLRETLEKAQARASYYQQKYGIVANDERVDYETARLNELSTQLGHVQGQATDTRSKEKKGLAADSLQEVMLNPTIQSLKAELARQEAKQQELGTDLGENHPQYQRALSEVAALQRKLNAETSRIVNSISTSNVVGRDREALLKGAIEEQKNRLLDLKQRRDTLALMTRDVESAQKAYDAVSQRLNQARLESLSTQSNVAVLTLATEPVAPSSPRIMLNLVLAAFVGGMLGLAGALTLEMTDRRVRSPDDVAEMLKIPVLGLIPDYSEPAPPRGGANGRITKLLAFRHRRTSVAVTEARRQ